jgi:hypothetical protein
MLGTAALAMWWDMAPGTRAEFEHWHTHEHFPERLALPGFLRASRWADANGGDGFFVMYELESHASLSSPEYLSRLNAPTPWSRKLMPAHSNMVRSQCVVLESRGGVTAKHALTVRFSPADEAKDRVSLAQFIGHISSDPGIAGAHLLKTQAPNIAPTTEQQIRGNADREADWVFVACGYDAQALAALRNDAFAAGVRGVYSLSLAMVPPDAR